MIGFLTEYYQYFIQNTDSYIYSGVWSEDREIDYMALSDAQNLIYQWCKLVYPDTLVFWSNNNIVQSELTFPHVVLKVISTESISRNKLLPNSSGEARLLMQKALILSVTYVAGAYLEPIEKLEELIDSLALENVSNFLLLSNISISILTNAKDISTELDDITEKRAHCEFKVYYAADTVDTGVGVIETINSRITIGQHEFDKTFSGVTPCQ